MRDGLRNRTFPVGLYGTLLAGLVGLTFPQIFAPVEVLARTLVTLPLRAYSILLEKSPAMTLALDPGEQGVVLGLVDSTLRDARGPAGHTPRVCQVIERRVGPLGLVDELVLDATRGELMNCSPLVTIGGGLVGFLDGVEISDAAAAQAPSAGSIG